MVYLSTKLLLEKSAKNKQTNKNNESVHNLWRILGTKLVLLVDFWDHIFKTVFPKHFFIVQSKMSRNMCELRHRVRNGQNLLHESPNFRNYFFLSNFTDNLVHFSTSLRPHYQYRFFPSIFFLNVFYSKLQDVLEHVYLASQIV